VQLLGIAEGGEIVLVRGGVVNGHRYNHSGAGAEMSLSWRIELASTGPGIRAAVELAADVPAFLT
jgi:hypothetical protein